MDLSTIFPTYENAPQQEGPYCHPTPSGGAVLTVNPIPGCQGCVKAGNANHESFHEWQVRTADGDFWEAATPWAAEMQHPFAFLWFAQAYLWLREKSTDGWMALWKYENAFRAMQLDGTKLGVPFVTGAMFPVVSASGNSMTIDTSGVDPRIAIDGTPIQAGDGVRFYGNNCAAGRLKTWLIQPDAPFEAGGSQPSTMELNLSRLVDPRVTTAADPDSAWSAQAFIYREIKAPENWIYVEPPDYFYGVQRVVEFDSGDAEWAAGAFELKTAAGASTRVAVPHGGASGTKRLLIVEVQHEVDGDWEDITNSVQPFEITGDGRLFIANTNGNATAGVSTLYLGDSVNGVSGQGALYDPDNDVAVRVTFYWRTDADDYANEPIIVQSERCQHCRIDSGAFWATPGGESTHIDYLPAALPTSAYCAKFNDGANTDDFNSRCYQCNTCPHFAPLGESNFLTPVRMQAAFVQLWYGVSQGREQQTPGVASLLNFYIRRLGTPGILSLVSPRSYLEYPNNYTPTTELFGAANHGYLTDDGYFRQGAAHCLYAMDSDDSSADDYTSPQTPPSGNGVFAERVTDWLAKNSTLKLTADDTDDLDKEIRRHFGANSLNLLRQEGVTMGDGQGRIQRLARGFSTTEKVLISNTNPAIDGFQRTEHGGLMWGAFNDAGESVASGSAEHTLGLMVYLGPMPFGTHESILAYQGMGDYLAGLVYDLTDNGDGTFTLTAYPEAMAAAYASGGGQETAAFYSGGNIVGPPEFARWRNSATYAWWNSLGPRQGAYAGHVIVFVDLASGALIGTDPIALPDLHQIVEANGYSGDRFHYLLGSFGDYNESLNAFIFANVVGRPLGVPFNADAYTDRADQLVLTDVDGRLGRIAASIPPGTVFYVLNTATMPYSAAVPSFYYDLREESGSGTSNWIGTGGTWSAINRVGGWFGLDKTAAATVRAANPTCIRADVVGGRYNHCAYVDARQFNETAAALACIDTAIFNRSGGAADIQERRYQLVSFYTSGEFGGEGTSHPSDPTLVLLSGDTTPRIWSDPVAGGDPATTDADAAGFGTARGCGFESGAMTVQGSDPASYPFVCTVDSIQTASALPFAGWFSNFVGFNIAGGPDAHSKEWGMKQAGIPFEFRDYAPPTNISPARAVWPVIVTAGSITYTAQRAVVAEEVGFVTRHGIYSGAMVGEPAGSFVGGWNDLAHPDSGVKFSDVYGHIGVIDVDASIAGKLKVALAGREPTGSVQILGASLALTPSEDVQWLDVTGMVQGYNENAHAAFTDVFALLIGATSQSGGFVSVNYTAVSEEWANIINGRAPDATPGTYPPTNIWIVEWVDEAIFDPSIRSAGPVRIVDSNDADIETCYPWAWPQMITTGMA